MKKSTVRTWFLVGVTLSTVAFIALTVNTLAQMPARTQEKNLTTFVVAGKMAWQRHDCIDCHTILGNGAYYAPDLTKVAQTRGAIFLGSWLPAPAGQMPNQHLTTQEVSDLIAFLTWVSNIDTNGWPPQPIVNVQKSATDLAGQGEALFQAKGCAACHGPGGAGTAVAPGLAGVSTRLDAVYLEKWLEAPSALKPGTIMPDVGLTETEIQALIAYLQTL